MEIVVVLLWICLWRVMFLVYISRQSTAGQDASMEGRWKTGSDVQGYQSLPLLNIRIELRAKNPHQTCVCVNYH